MKTVMKGCARNNAGHIEQMILQKMFGKNYKTARRREKKSNKNKKSIRSDYKNSREPLLGTKMKHGSGGISIFVSATEERRGEETVCGERSAGA